MCNDPNLDIISNNVRKQFGKKLSIRVKDVEQK